MKKDILKKVIKKFDYFKINYLFFVLKFTIYFIIFFKASIGFAINIKGYSCANTSHQVQDLKRQLHQLSANGKYQSSNILSMNTNNVNMIVIRNSKVLPLTDFDQYKERDIIQTGQESSVIFFPETRQRVVLSPRSRLKIKSISKSQNNVCRYNFELLDGQVRIASDHELSYQCNKSNEIEMAYGTESVKGTQIKKKPNSILSTSAHLTKNIPELESNEIAINPIGTDYSLELDKAIAELNGEVYRENRVKVHEGEIQVKIKKIKNSKKHKMLSQKEIEAELRKPDYEFEKESKRLRKGQVAKTKKNSKTRTATLEIVYPD